MNLQYFVHQVSGDTVRVFDRARGESRTMCADQAIQLLYSCQLSALPSCNPAALFRRFTVIEYLPLQGPALVKGQVVNLPPLRPQDCRRSGPKPEWEEVGEEAEKVTLQMPLMQPQQTQVPQLVLEDDYFIN